MAKASVITTARIGVVGSYLGFDMPFSQCGTVYRADCRWVFFPLITVSSTVVCVWERESQRQGQGQRKRCTISACSCDLNNRIEPAFVGGVTRSINNFFFLSSWTTKIRPQNSEHKKPEKARGGFSWILFGRTVHKRDQKRLSRKVIRWKWLNCYVKGYSSLDVCEWMFLTCVCVKENERSRLVGWMLKQEFAC